MDISISLEKIFGVVFVLGSVLLILSKKNRNVLFEIYMHPKAIFLTGILETVLGIITIFYHNIWALDYRTIITVIGWVLLIRGLGRIVDPNRSIQIIRKIKKMQNYFLFLLWCILCIGVFLLLKGFTG